MSAPTVAEIFLKKLRSEYFSFENMPVINRMNKAELLQRISDAIEERLKAEKESGQ